MAEGNSSMISVKAVTARSIVSLNVPPQAAAVVADRLALCGPLQIDRFDPGSQWVSPGCWLLRSDNHNVQALEERCSRALGDELHLISAMTDGLAVISVEGSGVRDVLASGCGLDLRPAQFPAGTCCGTRFAQVAVLVAAVEDERFELTVDRSFTKYLQKWLVDTASQIGRMQKTRVTK